MFKAYILSYSFNTLIRYSNSAKVFFAENKKLPISTSSLNLYLISEAEKGRTYTSIESILQAIKFVSKFLGFTTESLTSKQINLFLRKYCNLTVKRRDGFQKSDLYNLWEKIYQKGGYINLSKSDLRSFVIINFCYATLARFDCASQIKLENLEYQNNVFKITVPKSKTDQQGNGQKIYLAHKPKFSPHRLLCDYIHIFNLSEESYLFPPLKWNKIDKAWISVENKQLSYSAAYTGFKKLMKKFGINSTFLSLHSPRIGATTDMFQSGVSHHIIDKRGRWRDPKTKFIYAKDSEQFLINTICKL